MRPMENESYPWSSTLDTSLWNMLNEDLVEKIIVRLPFKFLFGVSSLLSKAWSQKFLSHSFQTELLRLSMSTWKSSTWKSYFPLFANDKKELIGYESGLQQWHRLSTESYFRPPPDPEVETRHPNLVAVGGSILCWMMCTRRDAAECRKVSFSCNHLPFYFCVSNPLTKRWKQLPPCPDMKTQEYHSQEWIYEHINVHVDCQGTNAYQVVVVEWINRNRIWDIFVHIFDTRSANWTMYKYTWEIILEKHMWNESNAMWSRSVYINGVIYMGITYGLYARGSGCQLNTPNRFSMISFHLENKTWSGRKFSINEVFINHREENNDHRWDSLSFVKLVVCGSNPMLVVFYGKGISGPESLCVYRLHLEFGLAFAVSTAPKNILDVFMKGGRPGISGWSSFYCAAGVGDCIYLRGRLGSSRWLMYNVRTQKWDSIPLASDKFGPFPDPLGWQPPCTLSAYQPDLNPFLEVGC